MPRIGDRIGDRVCDSTGQTAVIPSKNASANFHQPQESRITTMPPSHRSIIDCWLLMVRSRVTLDPRLLTLEYPQAERQVRDP